MKKCKCDNFKKLIENVHFVKEAQNWNFCVFWDKKMKDENYAHKK